MYEPFFPKDDISDVAPNQPAVLTQKERYSLGSAFKAPRKAKQLGSSASQAILIGVKTTLTT